MPSPFPGMDPFIESQEWPDFHTRFVTEIGNALVPSLRPKYETRVERRVYVARTTGEPALLIIPDVAVLKREGNGPVAESVGGDAGGVAALALVESAAQVRSVVCRLPAAEERRETFLTIRRAGTKEVVTVIELLSPDDKERGHKGWKKYLKKRNAVTKSRASLVELDLLRGGQRLPMDDPLPIGEFYAFVSRGRSGVADVYAWTLRRGLPKVPIPLAGDDPDVNLDLESVFTTVYDRAGYDYSLDYNSPVTPLLVEVDAEWAAALLKEWRNRPAAHGESGAEQDER